MLVDITPISKIDWESKGARAYSVPFTSDGMWARTRMPLYVASSGKPGKTVVAIGATHGDEYEGPVALKNLVNSFDPNRLAAGRLIVIPVFTVSAFYADQRASAEDGINMNRAFPGKADGSISFRMARFMTDEVLSRADVVIDIHSGGRGYQIAPCMSFHAVDDPELKQQFKETAFLFGTPFTMIYTSGMGTGLLTEEAEKMGKITIGSELGLWRLDRYRWGTLGAPWRSECHAALRSDRRAGGGPDAGEVGEYPAPDPEYRHRHVGHVADRRAFRNRSRHLGAIVTKGTPVAQGA